MTYFSHIRAGLIASALLLTTALASPALAETLPEISPRQIASDVEVKFNPNTGARDYIAPSFDPFEEDPSLAGTASLRSVSQATTIDGKSVRGGALLDMTFYYNSASNDPYDTRGYEDAVYLSGEYAPVTRRDNRILECNEQVQDVVYYHDDYYRPSLYGSLYRPYRHYRGHYGFSRGFGYDYGFGHSGFRGYSSFRGSRGFRRGFNSDRRRSRNRRNVIDRAIDDVRRASREERRGNRDERHSDRERQSDREGRRANREERRANREERRENRANRNRNRDRGERRLDNRGRVIGGPRRFGSNAGPAGRRGSNPRRLENNGAQRDRNNSLAGATARRPAPRPAPTPRAAAPTPRAAAPAPRAAAPAPRAERAAPRPRPQRAERARSRRAARRGSEIKSRNAPRRSSGRSSLGRKGNSKLRMMSFLPMASSWSRNVVRNVDTQCAREEMLTVHISQERLDAARFDGLTVLVLDRTGQEIPVFVPPNYVEGFRQAVNGRVSPNVSYQAPTPSAPVTREPVYQDPRPHTIEQAPCPAGTTQQSDGTCLQGGTVTYGGYPTR